MQIAVAVCYTLGMAVSPPTRLDDDVYAAARTAAAAQSRSVAQQLSHWARLGRELEAGGLASADATRVLTGAASYDDIAGPAQAIVRAAWDDQIDTAIGDLDLPGRFAAAGRGWVDADDDGNPIHRTAGDRPAG